MSSYLDHLHLPLELEGGAIFASLGFVIYTRYYTPEAAITKVPDWFIQQNNAFIEKTVKELREKFGEPVPSSQSSISTPVSMSHMEGSIDSLLSPPSERPTLEEPYNHVSAPTPWVVNMLDLLFYFNFIALGAVLLFTFLPGVQIGGLALVALESLAFSSLFILIAKLNSPDSWKEHCKSYDAWSYVILAALVFATLVIITDGFSLFGAPGIGISSPVIDVFANSGMMLEGISFLLVFSFGSFLYNGLSTKLAESQEAQLQEKVLKQIGQFQRGPLAPYSDQLNRFRHVRSETHIAASSSVNAIPRSGSESNLDRMQEEEKDVDPSVSDVKHY